MERTHEHPTPAEEVTVDVVVVGARVAGAATALLLARAGHRVALVDRATFPSDTLSTHAIARGGVVQLHRWGLLPALHATGVPQIRQVSFHGSGDPVVRTIKDRAGVDHLLAPRRHVLDPLLVAAAEAAGVEVHTGTTVTNVRRHPNGRVTGIETVHASGRPVRFRAAHVVGADGRQSTVARAVRAPLIDVRPSTAANHYAYVADLGATGFEYHVGGGRFAGVFPTNDGEACVWVSTRADDTGEVRRPGADKAAALVDLLAGTSLELAQRVRRAQITSRVRGAVALPNHRRRAEGPGWWLVGDAGYHRDPITGHGISDAFRDAELLADAIHHALTGSSEADARARYRDERDQAQRPIFDVTCELATFPAQPRFTELQLRLSELIELEANQLAGRPVQPWTRELVAA